MQEIIDITECCICAEMFTDPRMLPCIHTFCLKCLEATRSKSEINSGDKMPCPICRQQFSIPPGGLRGLQKNFFMDRLVEIAKISKPPETKVSCDVCLINKDDADIEVPEASKYCVECQENMCETCCVQHKRQKLLRHHQIVPFGSQVKDELMKTFVATHCKQHNKEELKMYCADCKIVICMMCFAESHQMHKCSDVSKVADGFRDEIDVFIANIIQGSSEGLEKKLKLDEVNEKFLGELALTEDAIKHRATTLKELIDKHATILLEKLAKIKTARIKETENEYEVINRHLTIFNSFNAYCSEIRSKGTPVDICRSVDDLRSRAKELQKENAMEKKQDATIIEVSFKTSSIEDMLKTENIVGSLGMLKNSTELPVSSDIMKVLQCSLEVRAVTKLDDEIYVMCSEWFESGIALHIFEDRDPFKNDKNARIEEIKWHIRVASSDKFRCLYIWDFHSKCVWRVMAEDLQVTKWLSNADEPVAMSTSNDGYLMLLRDDKGVKKLETYDSDAKISRSISLSSDIANPIRFLQESNGKFIIIHKSSNSVKECWVLSKLCNKGQMLHQFESKEKHQELLNTSYLCFDSESDRLFVAQIDNLKFSLVIFDLESLEWKQTLLLSEGRFNSFSLHYDSRKKQLLAGRRNEVVVNEIHV